MTSRVVAGRGSTAKDSARRSPYALIRMNVDAFKVNDIRRFRHDVGIEISRPFSIHTHTRPCSMRRSQRSSKPTVYVQRIDSLS